MRAVNIKGESGLKVIIELDEEYHLNIDQLYNISYVSKIEDLFIHSMYPFIKNIDLPIDLISYLRKIKSINRYGKVINTSRFMNIIYNLDKYKSMGDTLLRRESKLNFISDKLQ
mgnify:CR=1 FL=1